VGGSVQVEAVEQVVGVGVAVPERRQRVSIIFKIEVVS
jgi:hypothetical protein